MRVISEANIEGDTIINLENRLDYSKLKYEFLFVSGVYYLYDRLTGIQYRCYKDKRFSSIEVRRTLNTIESNRLDLVEYLSQSSNIEKSINFYFRNTENVVKTYTSCEHDVICLLTGRVERRNKNIKFKDKIIDMSLGLLEYLKLKNIVDRLNY